MAFTFKLSWSPLAFRDSWSARWEIGCPSNKYCPTKSTKLRKVQLFCDLITEVRTKSSSERNKNVKKRNLITLITVYILTSNAFALQIRKEIKSFCNLMRLFVIFWRRWQGFFCVEIFVNIKNVFLIASIWHIFKFCSFWFCLCLIEMYQYFQTIVNIPT